MSESLSPPLGDFCPINFLLYISVLYVDYAGKKNVLKIK